MFVCKKCGSIKYTTAGKSIHVGLYCADCGAWVKWLSPSEKVLFGVDTVATAPKGIKFDVTSNGDKFNILVHSFSVTVKIEDAEEFKEQLIGTVDCYKI